jgi:hypothetical protein
MWIIQKLRITADREPLCPSAISSFAISERCNFAAVSIFSLKGYLMKKKNKSDKEDKKKVIPNQEQKIILRKNKIITVTIPDDVYQDIQNRVRLLTFNDPPYLFRTICRYCAKRIRLNPKLEAQAQMLFQDVVDRNLNRLFYEGQYRVDNVTPPVFETHFSGCKRRYVKKYKIAAPIEGPISVFFQ